MSILIFAPGMKIFDGNNNEYTVTDFIDNGSFGDVFKIVKNDDKSIWAVKVMQSFPDAATRLFYSC